MGSEEDVNVGTGCVLVSKIAHWIFHVLISCSIVLYSCTEIGRQGEGVRDKKRGGGEGIS